MKIEIKNVWRVALGALVAPILFVGSAWAEQKYLVKIGVFKNMGVCPAYLLTPCKGGPVGPVKGVRVTVRTSVGKLQGRLRTARNGYARFRLPNGEYIASINLRGFRQPFIVKNARVDSVALIIGEARIKD